MLEALLVSPSTCQGKTWIPPGDISFAGHKHLVPINSHELAKAAANGPIAVVKENGHWQLVAVCGRVPGENLYIQNGRWLGSYQPEWLSIYPFQTTELNDKRVLSFDPNSGLLNEAGDGEPFFHADGTPTEAVASRIERIKVRQKFAILTEKYIKALLRARVLAPWPLPLCEQVGMAIEGLFMLNEPALNHLEDSQLVSLRYALPLAYSLNFSIQQSHILQRLSAHHSRNGTDDLSIDHLFGDDQEETFDFDF